MATPPLLALLAFTQLSTVTSSTAGAGPDIELPPAEETPAAGEGQPDASDLAGDLTRGLRDFRFAIAANTSIGGYGELVYFKRYVVGGDDDPAVADLRRLVLFVAHNFTDDLRFYCEFEVEHALAGRDYPGYAGFEQAFLDWDLIEKRLSLRVGMVLVPMGIVNVWHEPTTFPSVDRPAVERNVIPSTWREGAVGIFGELAEGLDYELYVGTGLDPVRFESTRGIAGGRQQLVLARAGGPAIFGRLEYEPILGTVAGLSAYFNRAGPNAIDLYDAAGARLELDVPVLGVSADARARAFGFEGRLVGAVFSVGDTAELRTAADADRNLVGPDTASFFYGFYGELAYNVLHYAETDHELLPFIRIEHYDTMASVAGRAKTQDDAAREITDIDFGIAYRPIPQVIFKGDVVLRRPGGNAPDENTLNVGAGYMF